MSEKEMVAAYNKKILQAATVPLLEGMNANDIRHTAFANALREGILKKSPFGKISKVKPLTKTQKLQMEIDTLKRRLELARQALAGDLDGYDPDWD